MSTGLSCAQGKYRTMTNSTQNILGQPLTGWRLRLYTVIFEADTRAGRLFDQWLIALILTSIVTAEMTARRISTAPTTRTCQECLTEGHLAQASFCFHCGAQLPKYINDAHERPALDQDRQRHLSLHVGVPAN